MTVSRVPMDEGRVRARRATRNRCVTAATALVPGVLLLLVAQNAAMAAAGALGLAVAVLLGRHAYRRRYEADGGFDARHLAAADLRFFLVVAVLAVAAAALAGLGLLLG
uniref:hypothetical protein n=1 Tax=Nonomuraea pusilla TaxID=46177 RepID=UPI000A4C870C|nr:hypothetical protein [Nonomuraea pusilla]